MDISKMINMSNLKDKCVDVYKNIAKSNIAKNIDSIYQKVDTSVRTGIMNSLGKDMYDYSQIEEITEFVSHDDKKKVNLKTFLKKYSSTNYDQEKTIIKNNSLFTNMIKDEKIVLFGIHYNSNCGKLDERYLVTNYGRFISLRTNCNNLYPQCWSQYEEYNFWIPIDYIFIMQTFCIENSNISGKIIMNLLTHFKTYLYDRKIINLTSMELIEENKMLREKYEKYEIDNNKLQMEIIEFNKKKEVFINEIKPYTDIAIEKNKIEADKAKLKMAATKLANEKQHIDEYIKKMENVNIDDLLA